MSLNTIGILGCGGHIGKYATEKLLRLGFQVLGAQRKSVTYFDDYKNYSFTNIDVMDKGQLDGFVEKCDIVINCISPSHLYGKIVKDAVCKKDKIYIDPSDMSFEQEERNVTGKCVTSCGYIPGISEFLPYIVAHKQFDKIRRSSWIWGWYGKEDKNIHREKIEKWRECTNGNVKIEEMAGGHFFVDIEKQCICEMINQKLLEVQ